MFVRSVLEALNTKFLVCANTLGNKALSDSDSDYFEFILIQFVEGLPYLQRIDKMLKESIL